MIGQIGGRCAGGCGRILIARGSHPLTHGEIRFHARGMCKGCYERVKRDNAAKGSRPLRTERVDREEVLQHWVDKRSLGWTPTRAAEDFGLRQDAYAKHLRRALAAGDDRGKLKLPMRERVLRHWAARREEGWTLKAAAEDFGLISRQAYCKNLVKARAAGDERGERYRDRQADMDESLLEDWALICDQHPWVRVGVDKDGNDVFSVDSVTEGAKRLGISAHSLRRLLKRARDRGDDRGNIIIDLRRSA